MLNAAKEAAQLTEAAASDNFAVCFLHCMKHKRTLKTYKPPPPLSAAVNAAPLKPQKAEAKPKPQKAKASEPRRAWFVRVNLENERTVTAKPQRAAAERQRAPKR